MNNRQLAAARKAMNRFSGLKVSVEEDGDTTRLTPYVIGDPERRGETIEVVKGVTPESVIDRNLRASCAGIA